MANVLTTLLNQAKQQVAGVVNNGPIAPDALRMFLRAQPAYVDNRERAAVVLDKGFKVYDFFNAYRTPIFVASVLGAIGSGVMLKRRRNHGSEAVALWSLSLAACVGAAWFTRPGVVPAAPADLPADQKGDFNVVAAIDHERASMHASNPNFADDTFNRLANLPGIREPLAQNPLVRAAIV